VTTRARITKGDGDPRHGTHNGYVNLQCRCPDCTEAHRIRHKEWMNAKPERLAKHALAQRLRYPAKRKSA
jgi:hypothetical protein